MEIEKRQTVDEVNHPLRGRCRLAHEHGPTTFWPESGEPFATRILGSGWSSEKGGSWVRIEDPEHGHVEMTVTSAGEKHDRYWSPLVGEGWLVMEQEANLRWEGDDGRVARFMWQTLSVGTPDYVRRSNRTTKNIPMVGDESNWITIECRDGTVMALRKEGPPKAPAQPTPDTQLGLFGEAR